MIANSSPLIVFSKSGRLGLLRAVVGHVVIPPAVWEEVASDLGKPGAEAVRAADWITVAVSRSLHAEALERNLGPGETEAIALALERGDRLLVDDLQARIEAERLGLQIVGSAGILLAAKWRGLLGEVAGPLAELEAAGLYLGRGIRQAVLRLAKEG